MNDAMDVVPVLHCKNIQLMFHKEKQAAGTHLRPFQTVGVTGSQIVEIFQEAVAVWYRVTIE